jgi:hypothetical protein
VIKLIDTQENSEKPTLVVSFEQTVTNPTGVIKELEAFLNRATTKHTSRVLKQQSLPREQISAGRSTSTFSFVSNSASSEAEIYTQIVTTISKIATKTAVTEFYEAIKNYNSRWPSSLVDLESIWTR